MNCGGSIMGKCLGGGFFPIMSHLHELNPRPEKSTWPSRLGSLTAIGGPPHGDTVLAFRCQMSMLLFLSWCSQWDDDKHRKQQEMQKRVLTLREDGHRGCWELWSPASTAPGVIVVGGGGRCAKHSLSARSFCVPGITCGCQRVTCKLGFMVRITNRPYIMLSLWKTEPRPSAVLWVGNDCFGEGPFLTHGKDGLSVNSVNVLALMEGCSPSAPLIWLFLFICEPSHHVES